MLRKPVLPLPKGYFGDVRLSETQCTELRAIAHAQLTRTLADEHAFVHVAQRHVDPTKWRLVKKKHQLRIFRRRRTSLTSAEDTHKPSMLSVGRMEGTLEDVVYASHSTSHEELRATIAFAGASTRDCTVLHAIDGATPTDPFHHLGLDWAYSQLPASLIVKPRDWCFVHAVGIETDASGQRFGYLLLHSVDVANCPAFDRRAVVRGRLQLAFIFREPVAGVVEVFSHGLFDAAGELITHFSTTMTASVLAGVFKLARCAEAKKLTVLALRAVQRKRFELDGHEDPADASALASHCALCRSTGSLFSSLKRCGVCGATVCAQCRVKKALFIGPSRAVHHVACCHTCIADARRLRVRPEDASFAVFRAQHLASDQFSTLESHASSLDDDHGSPLADVDVDSGSRGGDKREAIGDRGADGVARDSASDALSELDVAAYRFSTESGLSEDDVEKILASMLKERALDAAVAAAVSNDESDDDGPLSVSQLSPASPSAAARATTASSDDATADDDVESMTREQQAMYRKILALQTAADDVYSLTQANNAMMQSLRRQRTNDDDDDDATSARQ